MNAVVLATPIVTIDQLIAEWFNGLSYKGWAWGNLLLSAIAIFVCVILCGLVGLEREKRGRSAGLRTHLLVGVGSCIIMIVSIYGFPLYGDGTTVTRDVARLAAQVVAGVGFLGAGAIIHNNGGIKGLTTASTIWLVMAIGLACGSMNFILAIIGTVVVMIVLISFRKIERIVTRSNPYLVMLAPSDIPVMTDLLSVVKDFGYSITDLRTQIIKDGLQPSIEVTFKLSSETNEEIKIAEFVKALEEKAHAISVQVLNHH
ncbi:MAG TPA: MgtC/SapB family protein [Bacilli bacterium]|nr:MgtC/SapB family protein [Bacilli bacterium]